MGNSNEEIERQQTVDGKESAFFLIQAAPQLSHVELNQQNSITEYSLFPYCG